MFTCGVCLFAKRLGHFADPACVSTLVAALHERLRSGEKSSSTVPEQLVFKPSNRRAGLSRIGLAYELPPRSRRGGARIAQALRAWVMSVARAGLT